MSSAASRHARLVARSSTLPSTIRRVAAPRLRAEPAAQRDERYAQAVQGDRSFARGVRGTARVAGLTQEFRRDHFEVARRDLLVALCRSGHRTRSSAHVWTCSAPRDRPPCWIRAQLNAPGSLHAIRVCIPSGRRRVTPCRRRRPRRNRAAIDAVFCSAERVTVGRLDDAWPRTCRRIRR